MDIRSKIINAFENKKIPSCIFLDFAKAFNTVNHKILLDKLYYYGIRGNTINWLKSYLSNKKQCVQIGNELSDPLPIKCGVPQGSVLGPLFFLLYINDIVKSAKIASLQLFADNTCIFHSHKHLKVLEKNSK